MLGVRGRGQFGMRDALGNTRLDSVFGMLDLMVWNVNLHVRDMRNDGKIVLVSVGVRNG
jgi:hypothetical protein